MNRKKTIAALFLSSCISLNAGFPAFASEIDTSNDAVSHQNASQMIVQKVPTIDENEFHNLVKLPEMDTYNNKNDVVSSGSFSTDDTPLPDQSVLLNAQNIADVENLQELYSEKAGSQYEMQTFSDLLPVGTDAKAYLIDSYPGQMLQFSMDIPHNTALDYDLILFDVTNGTDQATAIDVCAYVTNSLFSSEAIGYANRGSTVQKLAIQVQAKGQTSDSDYFTMNICASVLENVDLYEPNESAFAATQAPVFGAGQALTAPGRLNTPIDEDWYLMDFSEAQGFGGLSITGIPTNMTVESYVAAANNELSRTGSTSNGDTLPIQRGINYFRITNKQGMTFSPVSYSLLFSPALQPNQADVIISVNGYCQRTSNEFLDQQYRFLYLMSADVKVMVKYYRDDIPIIDNDDEIVVELDDPSWTNPEIRYETKTGYSAKGVEVILPPIRGDRYDWVYTSVTSSKYGNLINNMQMANVTKYNGGELSQPCRHNGTCGLK
ncbi:MAG: hypothetical protein KHY89_11180 [Butyricicoccus pullicaecorum]|nr:hypothetical protein [Butyricicoccus pullicaecorum]